MDVQPGDSIGHPPLKRRTQAERVATMRARLMAATIECLDEQGYAAFSTNDVVRRAGVTRGALFHHFPTRAGLIAEAMWWHVKARSIEERAELLAAIESGASLEAQLRIAWHHVRKRAASDVEFRTARRADHDLRCAWEEARERNKDVEPRYNTLPLAWTTAPGDPTPELSRFVVGYFLTGMQVLLPYNTLELPEQAVTKFAAILELAFAAMNAAPPAEDDD